ncbi:hypothetical protein GCM10010510_23850 [Streptomyces anandii JCM 4720]|nr:hypothetical protein GCM10010510_23850 [Streptomyces anandii JCM 4720]
MELELRHLRTVRTIAEAGSLTKAASLLGLAQPALSAQLRRIEGALGGALFERGGTVCGRPRWAHWYWSAHASCCPW